MTELLAAVGGMSLTAGLTALVVLVLRWALVGLRVPAFVRLLLWVVVLFRMVCPVSFTSPWGAAALVEEALPTTAQVQTTREPVQQPGTAGVPAISPAEPLPEDAVVELTPMESSEVPKPRISPMLPLSFLWLLGVTVLWGWWLYTHRKLKKRMETAVRVAPGVLESDQPGPPFVLGFFPPKIYLPRGLEEPHRSYVLSHERFHLRRGDFLWKPIFFLAAAVHWFNPVLWLAWRLFCRDLEASCDEGVLSNLPEGERAGYARALLALAAPETSRLPAAFGEHDVSRRVKGALAYRRPAVLVAIILAVAAVGVGLWLAADPTGRAGLPQSPPAITLSIDSREAKLTAASWDGESPTDPAALLADAPRFTDDYAWSHSVDMSFGDQPRPAEGTYTDYLLQDGQWVEGHSGSMTYTIALQPRVDSAEKGTEERGVVFTYTWKEGFATRSATYAYRLLVPSVREDQMLEEPLMVSGGTILPVCEGGPSEFGSLIVQGNLCTLSMNAILTVNDLSEPFQSTETTLYLLDSTGTILEQAFVGGSGGGSEREQVRSAFGFPLNLEEKGWWNGEDLLLGVTVAYTWPDGTQTQWSTAFWAVPEEEMPGQPAAGEEITVRLWPDPAQGEDVTGVSIYVRNDPEQETSQMGVWVNGVTSWFDAGALLSGQHAWATPGWADLDGEGTNELAITRYDGHGTGASLEALHVLEPGESGGYTLAATFTLGQAEMEQVESMLEELGLDQLSCGYICHFPDLYTVDIGICDPVNGPPLGNYVGTLTCTLAYDGESLTLTDPAYVPSV